MIPKADKIQNMYEWFHNDTTTDNNDECLISFITMRRESNDDGIPKVPPEIQFFLFNVWSPQGEYIRLERGGRESVRVGSLFLRVCDIGGRKVTFFVLLLFFREMPRPLFLS